MTLLSEPRTDIDREIEELEIKLEGVTVEWSGKTKCVWCEKSLSEHQINECRLELDQWSM